jgi:hypothetical protein
MQKIYRRVLYKESVFHTLLVIFLMLPIAFIKGQSFVHPGILHTQADFDRMATKVNANAQPWKGSYDKLVSSPQAQLTWNHRATATIIRGGTGDNVALLYNDVAAAYQHALLYKITGNTSHGNKARDILNAWSATHTTLTGNADRYLAGGIFGYQFANAAEMMRGYSGFDVNRFRNYLLNVFYTPLVERFLYGNSQGADHNDACITNYWANWDLCNMAAAIAIGVFADNRTIFDRAINYFKTGAGNGSINNAIPFLHSGGLAQWQESGRDQGHSILGVGLMGSFCEIAWNQGQDMYGWNNNRFMQAAEYVARYNNGESVPFTTYNWGSGQNCAPNTQTVVSSAGRGENRAIWEMIYNHYARRKGLSVPNIAVAAAEVRPEGGPGGHATTYDQPGFGSLTYTLDAAGGVIPNGIYKIVNRASGKCLDNVGATADGATVAQWTSGSSPNQQWRITYSGGYYKMQCITGGKYLDNINNTADGSNVAQWANSTSPNQQWTITASGSYYKIINRSNGKCLDTGGGTANGAIMQFWPSGSSNNQLWTLTLVSSARVAEPEENHSNEKSGRITVFPNPATEELSIALPKSFEGEKKLEIHNSAGIVVAKKTFSGLTQIINIRALPSGLYILKVGNRFGQMSEKVIKK